MVRAIRGSLSERLWVRVDKRGPDDCWLWIGRLRSDGYARLRVSSKGEERILAHRATWEEVNGPVPDGLCVLHRCDVRHCVNPAHLWLGTQTENIADMDAKGRRRKIWKRTADQPERRVLS